MASVDECMPEAIRSAGPPLAVTACTSVDLWLMQASVPNLDAALRALADRNRRRILAVVADQARPVGEIAEHVAMSQQAVSFHLRVLRGAGLVTERRERTRHLFVVRTDGLLAVQDFLDGFWPSRLAALKAAAEAEFQRSHIDAVHAEPLDG